jgi:phage tail-like protein
MADEKTLKTSESRLLQYLPEIYREERAGKEFLEGFLRIFEKVIERIDRKIAEVPAHIDPTQAPGDFIPWLAQWLSLDLYELLEDKNRKFILEAFELYKRKGTLAGLKELARLLTEQECSIKEYTFNVIRTAGMESRDGPEIVKGNIQISKTVDTSDRGLLARMGTFYDGVHYVTETGKNARYADNVIGLYIFLTQEKEPFLIKEDQLHKIINSFLPVFVRVIINITGKTSYSEVYKTGGLGVEYGDEVTAVSIEKPGLPQGVYENRVNWQRLYTYSPGTIGYTFVEDMEIQYRTPNMEINGKLKI